MDGCLYDPADCESERTVIISELQGGENDPEQLLDTEVTADRVQGASVSPPDDRLADGSADDDARRSVRPLSALLRAVERDAGDRRRRRHRRGAEEGREAVRRDCSWRALRRASGRSSRSSRPSGASCCASRARPRTGRRRFTRRRSKTTSFFPLLVADAVLNGAAGLNIWSGGGVSRPQRSARLYRALVDKGLASTVSGAADADAASISVRHPRQRRRRPDAACGRGGRAGGDRSAARGRHHARRAEEGPRAAARALRLRRRQRHRHRAPDRLFRDDRVVAGVPHAARRGWTR